MFFPLNKSIIGFVAAFLSNQGIMPFSILGIFSILSTTILLILSLKNFLNSRNSTNEFMPILSSLISLFFTGAGGYLRIFITLTPFQSIWISSFNFRKKKISNSNNINNHCTNIWYPKCIKFFWHYKIIF